MLGVLQTMGRRSGGTTRAAGPVATGSSVKNPVRSDDDSSDRVKQRFFRDRPLDSTPISLTHQRIYILPTLRGLLFIGGLLVMLVTSMNYALGLGYALCFLLTGLFSAALLATFRNVQGITLTSAQDTRCVLGERIAFELELHNPNRLDMHMLSVSDRADNTTEEPCISTQQSVTTVLPVPSAKRGWQQLGRLRVKSEYPIGLWFAWGYWHVPVQALVLPASETDAPPLPQAQADQSNETSSENRQSQASSGEIHAIRPYQAGDNLSSIHWKASARGQGMQTREFEQAQAPQSMELHWQHTASLVDTEKRLSRLAAWCRQCDSEDRTFSLQLPGLPAISNTEDDGSSNSGNSTQAADHLHECLKALALFDNDGTDKA